ncbi:MAG TPA: hypothetical protein VGP46_00905, partial [Acidimicrobiales bacterium]|nr:hypothetical protein [Acidimicrobiales bacterium]
MVWKLAVALGVILLALGVTGVVLESGHQGLEYQVLASPAGGMTPVYVGAGGPDATQVLPGATRALPIDGVPGAPVGPTEFLEPAKLTFISHGQSE